jgi:hypothetical protein
MPPSRFIGPMLSSVGDQMHAAYARRAAEAPACSDDDWRRDHLGASVLGHECDRFLWLSFRWAVAEQKKGQTLRLLERGKREELWVLEDLQRIGVRVVDTQKRVQWGHVGGSCDAILLGVPEAPDVPHLGEIKTSNGKQFAKLVEQGVKRAKPEHYVQMQVYMHGLGLQWALYLSVCKDNDEIHAERVPYSAKEAQAAIDRGGRIVAMEDPPARKLDSAFAPCMLTSKDGTQWPCRFWNQCWKGGLPAKNCRTCVSSSPTAMDDCAHGLWECDRHGKSLNPAEQRAGCSDHLSIPAIVGHQVVSIEGRRITYQAAGGEVVEDGQ